jgi:NDP-sugar pyrophosphorylase family protein
MKYKVLLTTSGLGQRLGDITRFTNKSLVRVGEKPTISYIVERYPEDVEIIVTIGHFGDQVRQFLGLVYPQHSFTFVEVDRFQGPGSSLAYSILQTKKVIDCPFIFHACDTIVEEPVPEPSHNWLGGYAAHHRADYASFEAQSDGRVVQVKDKGEFPSDYHSSLPHYNDFSYMGLAGIFDHELFFERLQELYDSDPNNSQFSDVGAIRLMLDKPSHFTTVEFKKWLDVGNVDGLVKARESISDKFKILDKLEESIFIFDESFVVKFFYDTTLCQNRVKRAEILKGLVPPILGSTDNFYKYAFTSGQLLASCATETIIDELLDWASDSLWELKSDEGFSSKCYDFYFTKTEQRLKKFTAESHIQDVECIINGIKIPSVSSMLQMIDSEWLCNGRPCNFHGDFILDNIIYNEGKFTLLDWRQDFAGSINHGDVYYDLAKLNHNLVFNHDIVNKGLFTIQIKDNEITCDILRSHNLVKCQKTLQRFVEEHSFNPSKVDIITALIWINMAPLHHHPLNVFLFYFGKLHLYKAIYETS